MSRIHEALKKAEQERAASQGGPAQPSFATPAVEAPLTATEEFPSGAATGAPERGVPLTSGDAVFRQPLKPGRLAGALLRSWSGRRI